MVGSSRPYYARGGGGAIAVEGRSGAASPAAPAGPGQYCCSSNLRQLSLVRQTRSLFMREAVFSKVRQVFRSALVSGEACADVVASGAAAVSCFPLSARAGVATRAASAIKARRVIL